MNIELVGVAQQWDFDFDWPTWISLVCKVGTQDFFVFVITLVGSHLFLFVVRTLDIYDCEYYYKNV